MEQDFLYSAQFDYRYDVSFPKKFISLLFVPRSGSTLLACLMAQTEVLGFPLEYFAQVNFSLLSNRLPRLTSTHIDPLLHVRSSRNGVFSYKWNDSYEQMPEISAIRERLKPDYFIVMDREDKQMQARSLAIALKTNEWVLPKSKNTTGTSVVVDADEVEKTRITLVETKKLLYSIINFHKRPFIEISYEALLANPQNVIEKIGTFCGERIEKTVSLDQVPIAKQSSGGTS